MTIAALCAVEVDFYFLESLDKIVLVIGPMHVSSYDVLDGHLYNASSLQSSFKALIVVMKLVATVTSVWEQ